jgi:hypothetical protein
MIMGMQSIFVVGGENLPALPDAYANIYLHGDNFKPWNMPEIDQIECGSDASYWED